MQLEVGMILEGKVSGITNFGAFVDLPEGKSGMVHISEVASTYVNDINDILKKGQTVKVKIISINENGKIALSIKKAEPNEERKKSRQQNSSFDGPGIYEWQKPKQQTPESFEDMMSKFKQTSDERIAGLKKGESTPHRTRHNSKPR